jgi:6-pyruvoyltetrahydropterin/6-carboxytetrahydropterin synthase
MQVTKVIKIEAAHRLLGYEGACSNIHGHSYKFEITMEGTVNEKTGMVLDFKELKNSIGGWLLDVWDHALILEQADPLANLLIASDLKIFIMQKRPTAENMAEFLLASFPALKSISVWETETSYAYLSKERELIPECLLPLSGFPAVILLALFAILISPAEPQ